MKFKKLNEDKTVNPGGKPFPKNGWCVIVCGGPGIGKSSAINNLINIDAKHLDVDEVKTMWLKTTEFDDGILRTSNGKEYSMGEYNIEEPYDLSNPKFTSFVHEVTKPLAKARKNAFINAAGNYDEKNLPNVIFDITGDDITKFMDIINTCKPLGYKVAIVLVAGEVSQAIEQNEIRARKVKKDLLLSKHRDVLYTIMKFFESSLIDNVDECYIIVQFRVDISSTEGKLKYIKKDNVYRVKENGKQVFLPDNIRHLILDEYDKLISGLYD